MKATTTLLSVLLLPAATTAFSTPSQFATKTTRFAVASSSNDYYQQTLEQARLVAFTPTSTPEDARKYLFEVLHLQTGCSTGMLPADEGVCDNVQEMADLIAHLRVKASERRRETVLLVSILMSASVISLIAWWVQQSSGSVVPFRLQEWMWAARDGYLPTLLAQNWKYGGFLVDDDTVQPFLWEEWMWAARDGYLPTMVADWYRNGGL